MYGNENARTTFINSSGVFYQPIPDAADPENYPEAFRQSVS